MPEIVRIKKLVKQLNDYRDQYYNHSNSEISDYEYDALFDELKELEERTGIILSNSPTQTVGYEVVSKLNKVRHNHPMLSLGKTKSVKDLVKFISPHWGVLMLKMDGLTVSLTYSGGKLVAAETRGDGETGEDILHTAKVFSNIPLHIEFEGDLVVDGEAIIDKQTFERINSDLPGGEKYKNSRNLVSGSVRQLDAGVAAGRSIQFVAWKCVSGIDANDFSARLSMLSWLGFDVVPHKEVAPDCGEEEMERLINQLKEKAKALSYPIDGMVLSYTDIAYGESLGATGHHLRSQIAYKFYDEEEVTRIREVEWSIGRTGVFTPVAVFDPVDLDGTEVSRASVHNVSIFKSLQLGYGDEVTVYKANQIIPQIRDNLTRSRTCVILSECPLCGTKLVIERDRETEVLKCPNPDCDGKLFHRLNNFISRDAMNIMGLSSAFIGRCMDRGWLNKLSDIYDLPKYQNEIALMSGYGDKSSKKICDAIRENMNTPQPMSRFLVACGIPGIGKSQAKAISQYYGGKWNSFVGDLENGNSLDQIDGVGQLTDENIKRWFRSAYIQDGIAQIAARITFEESGPDNIQEDLSGKIFCITGSLEKYPNRSALAAEIEKHGGKVSGSVSKSTDFLICNDLSSKSSKVLNAIKFGVPIISETDLNNFISKPIDIYGIK